MKLLLPALLFVFSAACAASIPKEEHDTMLSAQKEQYEARLSHADKEQKREARARDEAAAEAKKIETTFEARIDQLEGTLADKQRTLDDVTSQLVELQDAFGKLSSKERSKIEGETQAERAQKAAQEKLRASFAESFKEELASNKMFIEAHDGGLRLRFKDGALYTRGATKLAASSKATVDRLAASLKAAAGANIAILVHTDAVKAQDGWSVTDEQGAALVRALQKLGVDPSRLSYTSFGQYRPMSTNDTEEGRAENRRIEVLVEVVRTLPKR